MALNEISPPGCPRCFAQTCTFVHTAVFKDSEPPPLAFQDGAGSLGLNVMRAVGLNKGGGVEFWCVEDKARKQEEQSGEIKASENNAQSGNRKAEQIEDGAN